MAWAVSLVLVVVWLMSLVTGYTSRGIVHLLPVLAVAIGLRAGGRAWQRTHPTSRTRPGETLDVTHDPVNSVSAV